MINPIKYIREFRSIKKYRDGKATRDDAYEHDTVSWLNKVVSKKNGYPQYMRDMLAAGAKKYRSYEVNKEWVDAKQKYIQYQLDHPDVYKSVEEVPVDGWVTVVGYAPVRGERYNEYYAGAWGGIGPGTYKVKEHSTYNDSEIVVYEDGYGGHTRKYNEMRPATEDEIHEARQDYSQQWQEELLGRKQGYEEQVKMINNKWSWV